MRTVFLVSLIFASGCTTKGCENPGLSPGEPRYIIKIRDCDYAGLSHYGLVHAGDCKNPVHANRVEKAH